MASGSAELVSLRGAGLHIGGRQVLAGVSLALAAGETLALVGPNGAGKTSLLRLVAGRLAAGAGTVAVFGSDPFRHAAARRGIGWVPQDIALYPRLTVRENLDVFARFLGLSGTNRRLRVEAALALGQVGAFADAIVGSLSGGYQRRTNIAVALLGPPLLALLDEPTQGVDLEARGAIHGVLDELRARGAGLIVATHDFAEAERLADRVGVMMAGRVVLLDSLTAILDRIRAHGPEHDIVLRGAAPQAARQAFTAAGFEDVADGLAWHAQPHCRPDVPTLLAALQASGVAVREVRSREPGLESVYRSLLRHPAQPHAAAA